MLTINDLSDIYSLFIEGFVIGGILSAIPFIISYAINGIIRIINNNI